MAKNVESLTAHPPAVAGLPDSPLCSRAQVLAAYGGKSVSWLYEGMALGRIPRPVKIGPNSVAWVTEEIRRDIAGKIAAGPVEIKPRVRKPAPEAA
jgi:predicted DNA-binding transcriptional regulator AlpA